MSNDDLGQFPAPSNTSTTPPTEPGTPAASETTPATENLEPASTSSPSTPPTFEETPDEIPSATTPAPMAESFMPDLSMPATDTTTPAVTPISPTIPPEIPASIPTPKGGSAFGSLIAIVLLLISGVAIAVTVFLFSQSKQLRQQLSEVTQTLEQQRTTVTPSPTPTIIDFPTPTATPEATESAIVILIPTPTATPEATINSALPLINASKALKVAINHRPNAQLIIVKTENATSPSLSTTKYFFRQDLTTKKYFYVLIEDDQDPEIVDKAIYVTPDNNIPSLNDLIQGNAFGIDLDEALKIANAACTSNLCATATVKAQYIKSGDKLIWQLTFDPVDVSKEVLVAQLNATTKEILYKSTGF